MLPLVIAQPSSTDRAFKQKEKAEVSSADVMLQEQQCRANAVILLPFEANAF